MNVAVDFRYHGADHPQLRLQRHIQLSKIVVLAALALIFGASVSAAHAGTPCTDLSGTKLPLDRVAITLSLTATDQPAGALSSSPQSPPFCEIAAVISSNAKASQSQISVVVWLPETGWNGRFLGTGVGGFGGTIDDFPLQIGLMQGYAVANTDLGTGLLFKCNSLFCGSRQGYKLYGIPVGGLFGQPAAIEDFGYGATHLMTLAAKQLIEAFYRTAPAKNYFHGCSTGGFQALQEALRYPHDYDGILAGSPAYDRTHLITGANGLYEATHFAPDAFLTSGARAVAHAAVLKSCAGHDGGVATDPFLTQPALCRLPAATLQCTGAAKETPCTGKGSLSCTCLTAHQVVALSQLWNGTPDSIGSIIDPGYERGAENANDSESIAPTALTEPAHDSLDYWAFGPHFQWQSLFATVAEPAGVRRNTIVTLDSTKVGTQTLEQVVNAMHADLRPFAEAGGKLLIYAGYADPTIPTADTFDYLNQAILDAPGTPTFARLYLAPGMWHCTGGPGLDAFGNISGNQPPNPGSPADDIFAALVAWREAGSFPRSIIATHYVNDDQSKGIAFQRPLCPYPDNARYIGKGNPDAAENFVCEAGKPVVTQGFGKGYGPD
jgi:feruloyl esterase